jgi:DNA uptake protein ComE-like DNA-binding protein
VLAFPKDLTQFYNQQVDINKATFQQIRNIEGLSEEQAEAIYEWRETRGLFSSIYELMEIPEIDAETFSLIKYKIRIEVPEDSESYTLSRIARLQTRLASEDGAPTEIAIDEWEDLLLDPLNINQASVDDILVLDRVTPIDAAAVVEKRKTSGKIRNYRSLRGTSGLTDYGFRNMRDFVTYSAPEEKWAFRGNLRIRWDYINTLEDEEFGPETQITALRSHMDELTLQKEWDEDEADSVYVDNLAYQLMEKRGWTEADFDSAKARLRKEIKELSAYKPTGRMIQKYRARLGRKIKSGLIFEKDQGEKEYTDLSKGYLSFNNFGTEDYQLKKIVLGHYRLAFGQGLIMDNADERRDRTTDKVVGLFGDATTTEEFSLFGVAAENNLWRFKNIFFYSKDKKDAILNPDGTVNSLVVTDYQLSTIKDKVEEETYGANIRFDMGDLAFMPIGTYIGFTGYQSKYDKEFKPIPETLDIPDFPANGNHNEIVDKNYTKLWEGDTRTVLGGEFRTIFDNFSLEGEYAKVKDHEDSHAYVLKARTLFERIYLLAIYRHYSLGYDNPYARPFAEQAKYDDTLLEKDYRLSDPLYSYLTDFPVPKAEEGLYLETRYEISRKLTLTKVYVDMWRNLAYNLPNVRVQGEVEYRPIFPLRFRIKHKYQRKQKGRTVVPSKSVTNETTFRVFALITQHDFFQIKMRYGKVDLISVPSLAGEEVGSGQKIYTPRDIDMDGGFIEASWDHNFSDDLSVEGGLMLWNTNGMSQWNFEDNTIDFMEGRGRKYYVVISDRISPNVQLRLKFRNKYTEYPHTGLYREGELESDFAGVDPQDTYHYGNMEFYRSNSLLQKRNIYSLQVQFDYRW